MTLGEGPEYCSDCATWHTSSIEHALLKAMTEPITVPTELLVPETSEQELMQRENNVLVGVITEWLYTVGIGFRPETDRQKLASMIQKEGFRQD